MIIRHLSRTLAPAPTGACLPTPRTHNKPHSSLLRHSYCCPVPTHNSDPHETQSIPLFRPQSRPPSFFESDQNPNACINIVNTRSVYRPLRLYRVRTGAVGSPPMHCTNRSIIIIDFSRDIKRDVPAPPYYLPPNYPRPCPRTRPSLCYRTTNPPANYCT